MWWQALRFHFTHYQTSVKKLHFKKFKFHEENLRYMLYLRWIWGMWKPFQRNKNNVSVMYKHFTSLSFLIKKKIFLIIKIFFSEFYKIYYKYFSSFVHTSSFFPNFLKFLWNLSYNRQKSKPSDVEVQIFFGFVNRFLFFFPFFLLFFLIVQNDAKGFSRILTNRGFHRYRKCKQPSL